MNEPVRVISDLHLGHRVSRIAEVQALRPLISGAGTVVFNGDTWQELAPAFRARSAEMLEGLKALCAAEGCTPVFLAGNHDPGWPGSGWLSLAGGRIVVTHGDGLLFDGAPWKRELLARGDEVRAMWAEHPEAGHDPGERLRLAREIARRFPARQHSNGRKIWQRAWDAVVPPERAWKMVEAWLTQATAGGDFCDRYFPRAEFLVIGHFHRAGSWRVGGRRMINTGSFVSPGRADWVEWRDGWLSRGRVAERGDGYRMAEVFDRWRL